MLCGFNDINEHANCTLFIHLVIHSIILIEQLLHANFDTQCLGHISEQECYGPSLHGGLVNNRLMGR